MVVLEETVLVEPVQGPGGSTASAASWPAILAGAVAAVATSLILAALGGAAGLASLSPWQGAGVSAAGFTVMAGVWIIIIQWAASAMGGYLTGRLRVRWAGVHSHEVFFRDTAHGFLAWALSTVIVAALVAGAAGATANAAADSPYAYQVSSLLRAPGGLLADAERSDVDLVFAQAVTTGQISDPDRLYLTNLVASRTGLSPGEAQARVEAAIVQAKQAADKARKAASGTALFTAISLLIGAFIACVAAALGGKQRDEHL